MQRGYFFRFFFYLIGLLFLAFGITLNTTTGLGVTAIISVSHAFSVILGVQIGDTTLCLYSLFIIIEIIINLALKKRNDEFPLRRQIIFALLQLPLSLVFTRVMNIFESVLPMLTELNGSIWQSFPMRFLTLIIAVLFTGVGAAMSLDMRIIPNPGDGLVQALSDFFKKDVGLMKNIVDVVNICIATAVGFIFLGRFVSVGIGTLVAVIGVGRVIYFFNKIFLSKMLRFSGMN